MPDYVEGVRTWWLFPLDDGTLGAVPEGVVVEFDCSPVLVQEVDPDGVPGESQRWWLYPLADGTLQAVPVTPAWGGGGILVEEVMENEEITP